MFCFFQIHILFFLLFFLARNDETFTPGFSSARSSSACFFVCEKEKGDLVYREEEEVSTAKKNPGVVVIDDGMHYISTKSPDNL